MLKSEHLRDARHLSPPNFVDKAPPEVAAETRANLQNLKRKRVQLDDALKLADELA